MSRSHKNEIEIDAPPAAVWKALSEGEELARWFATRAEVEPGEGGRWKVSWDDSPVAEYARIDTWEPQKHLRLVYESSRGESSCVLVEDFEILALDGGARALLRVVASGFGSEASWDDEFEGTKNGWAVFIRNLRHYLEHHRGQACTSLGFPFSGSTASKAEVFEALFGEGGVLALAGSREEGSRVELATSFGERLSGRVDFARPPALLGLALDDIGLLRAELVGSDKLFVHVMLLAWGEAAAARVQALRKPLGEALGAVLGAGEGAGA